MDNIINNIDKATEIAIIFKALSHPIRAQMVAGLMDKEESNVTNMVKSFQLPQPTISQHINVLKTLGVVKGYRRGNQICYKIENDIVRKIYTALR